MLNQCSPVVGDAGDDGLSGAALSAFPSLTNHVVAAWMRDPPSLLRDKRENDGESDRDGGAYTHH
jgi:hypothetical protein